MTTHPTRFAHVLRRVSFCSLALFCCSTVLAFNPPVDRKGPLTVRIEGPAVVSETDKPIEYRVVLENGSDQKISGRLRFNGVDRWQCEPEAEVPFETAAHGSASYPFRVTAGVGTYAAYYPLHAYATFIWKGEERVAHPILILESKVTPPAPAVEPLPWQPLQITGNRALALWEMPTFRAVVHVFGQPAKTMPVGWTGSAQPSRASLTIPRGMELGGERRFFSGEYEKYAQLFYAVDATKTINDKAYDDMMEYLQTSLKELQRDLAWRKDFLSENPQIEEQRLTETMQTIEKEYLTLLDYLKKIA